MKKFFLILFLFPSLVFGQNFFETGQSADLMISGIGFNQTGGSMMFNHPNGLASNGTNLIMCDRFNNRVLVWNTAPTTWNQAPDLVLGQDNFNTNYEGRAKNQMNWPGNVSVSADGKLAVADTHNDRILIWNTFPTQNGQAADIEVDLSKIANPGLMQRWTWPWGVWTDGTKLAVAATQGSTLLFWNNLPSVDNLVPDYTITHEHFGTPRNISTDGSSYFFVGDHNAKVNMRAGTFYWNSYPTSTDQAYDFYKEDWVKGTKLADGKLLTAGLMNLYVWNTIPRQASTMPNQMLRPGPYNNGDGVDVVFANNKYYVCNYNGNNVLVYNNLPSEANPDPDFALGVSNIYHNTLDSIGYIQNPAFTTDGTKMIVTSDFDNKIYVFNQIPTQSGAMADQIISTKSFEFAPWDNVLYNNTFVAAGKNKVCVWNNGNALSNLPSTTFTDKIGSASFSDLKGVALDQHFFYLTDFNGNLFIWEGIPANNTVNPKYTLNFPNSQLARLNSDGTYLSVTKQSPSEVVIYKVADLVLGNTSPFKTISGVGFLNLPTETITFNGSLAIVNNSFHDVLLWKDIHDAPDPSKMVVLGNTVNGNTNSPSIKADGLFMPGGILYENNHLWVGEFKFSSRIVRYSIPGTTTSIETNSLNGIDILYSEDFNTLKLYPKMNEELSLRIYSISGKIVKEKTFQGVVDVDLTSLYKGVYVLYVYNENKIVYQHKLIR